MPWFGCSATLDPDSVAEARDLSGFDPSTCIQRSSVDRLDITFAIKPIRHAMNNTKGRIYLLSKHSKEVGI
jgi:hypothetical protein